ncbi:hypothetical protein GNZ12_06765 [Paraburkholderia sp. 1N]|uniref:LITAF domain-containing protein n=1 Tax=Paraburkholderia solitsugae TaxID=2675748 RepID=A0ABX2BK56_9BURK|nr:hypothetical protein [Paraburkholderia solitsugae]NPT41024.1 hypothetical protein [Paraburkholderia solitsugae]
MRPLQCPKCQNANASIYKKRELRKAFGAAAAHTATAGVISPAVFATISAGVLALLTHVAAFFHEREQDYGVCASCGHLWKID